MLAQRNARMLMATIGFGALSAFALMSSGCGAKNAPQAKAPGNSNAVSTGPQSVSAVPAKEKFFVAPGSQGPPSGSQFITRNGQMPSNGSQP